jgi:hypothetical protein
LADREFADWMDHIRDTDLYLPWPVLKADHWHIIITRLGGARPRAVARISAEID